MSWMEEVLEFKRKPASRARFLPESKHLAYELFRREGEIFELIESGGYPGDAPEYEFLNSTGPWERALKDGMAVLDGMSGQSGLFAGRKIRVVAEPPGQPDHLLVVEADDAGEDSGKLLQFLLASYRPGMEAQIAMPSAKSDLPAWLEQALEKALDMASPLLLVSEPGSGRGALTRALIGRKFGPQGEGSFFHPGRLSEAVQLREIFGDPAGRRLGAESPGLPMLERSSPALIIEEVGDLSPQAQLRFLGHFTGATGPSHFWIFGTSKDLNAMTEAGMFQGGLHEILKKSVLVLTPLRSMKDKIGAESERLLAGLRQDYQREVALSTTAMDALQAYSWPGNWRELRQTLESAFLTNRNGLLRETDLRLGSRAGGEEYDDLNLRRCSENMERRLILRAFALHGGNQVHMARALGISRGSLQYKMEKYQINR